MSGAEMVVRQKELERCEDAISKLRASYADHQTWAPEDRGKLRNLKERREILMKMLGVQV
jgi:hypothetical protein